VGVGTLQAPPKVVEDPESGRLQAPDEEQTAYRVVSNPVYARTIAGEIIGSANQTVPMARTRGFRRIYDVNPAAKSLGFLAGEMLQDQAARKPGEVWTLAPAGFIPARRIHGKAQADGTPAVVRDFTAPTPGEAVAMCYRKYGGEYRDGDGKAIKDAGQKIPRLYGEKDERFSIGFHRFGPDSDRELGRDHYEIVSLGVAGFNPYRTDDSGSFVALEQEGDSKIYKTGFKYDADDLQAENAAPTFVFDRPIDGAGTMVVNGNLLVRSRFAYYGTLVVLGDVIVEPFPRKNVPVYGASGNPVDASGNSLIRSGGNWYYRWTNVRNPRDARLSRYYLDYEGMPVKDANGNPKTVEPLVEDVYDGEFIVQGNLILKGRLINRTVEKAGGDAQKPVPAGITASAFPNAPDAAYASLSAAVFPGGDGDGRFGSQVAAGPGPDSGSGPAPETVTGRVSLFWSAKAIMDTASLWSENKTRYDRLYWNVSSSTIPVDSLWNGVPDIGVDAKDGE
ncbi:MAG: hypothetical protein LBE84_05920, partial [Planctomycetota bacterium]|nr:hypothetical protein [Planctomycetota bacterium]